MIKLLKLFGVYHCLMCGKRKLGFMGKFLLWTDDGEVNYNSFTCKECIQNYREE